MNLGIGSVIDATYWTAISKNFAAILCDLTSYYFLFIKMRQSYFQYVSSQLLNYTANSCTDLEAEFYVTPTMNFVDLIGNINCVLVRCKYWVLD